MRLYLVCFIFCFSVLTGCETSDFRKVIYIKTYRDDFSGKIMIYPSNVNRMDPSWVRLIPRKELFDDGTIMFFTETSTTFSEIFSRESRVLRVGA